MSRLKAINSKDLQEILRKHFFRPNDSYAVSFSAQVDQDLPTEHNVVGTLYLDQCDGVNANQLETRLRDNDGKSNLITFKQGRRKLNVYPLFNTIIPDVGDIVKIVDKDGTSDYKIESRLFDFTNNNITCYCAKV